MNRGRAFILGLDGVPFSLIDPWMKSGELPALARLASEGVRGDLQAIWPINSISSWTSFLTGENPARHGTTCFLKFLPGQYQRRFVTSRDIKSPLLFEYAPDINVAVVNVPSLYPPIPVNGVMISGMLAPQDAADLTYPIELRGEIEQEAPYLVDCDFEKFQLGKFDSERLLHQILLTTRRRFKAIEYLIENKPWDLFIAIITGPDRLLHFFGRAVWEDREDDPVRATVANYFVDLDKSIGRLLDRLNPEDSVVVLSDHGFGPLRGRLRITKWLVDWGYLKLRSGWDKPVEPEQPPPKSLAERLRGLDVLGLRRLAPDRIKSFFRPPPPPPPPGAVVWEHTKVFPGSYCEQGLFINLRGRQPKGIVEPGDEYRNLLAELEQRLKSLAHPVTGEPFSMRIIPKEGLLWGPYYDEAPDLFVEIEDGCYDFEMPDRIMDDHLRKIYTTPDYVDTNPDRSGSHREMGIFIARGPAFRKSHCAEGLRILDALPTIIHTLGQPVPEPLDGRVRRDLLQPPWSDRAPIRVPLRQSPRESHSGLERDEEEEIAARLKGIGYIG